jgi:hypothetical protein
MEICPFAALYVPTPMTVCCLLFLPLQVPESPALPLLGAAPLSATGAYPTQGPPSTAFTTGE